jgi:uncharacterized protein YggU (UPF0235/DUF167 family)
VRVAIHVRPGSSRTAVGGEYGDALVVRVVEPADAGRANRAALVAIAAALGVPRRAVTLVSGATARRKIIEIDAAPETATAVRTRLRNLLATRSGRPS